MPARNRYRPVMPAPSGRPVARANIMGDYEHPCLQGTANFYCYRSGTLLLVEVGGLPHETTPCAPNIFAMHIHAGDNCTSAMDMRFSGAGGHYNPTNCPHPAHAGDLPPLFGNHGYAWQGVYTERFKPWEVVGKTIIIHAQRDDFTSQPAGDAGGRIACGVIYGLR